jgi:hypothetical protein
VGRAKGGSWALESRRLVEREWKEWKERKEREGLKAGWAHGEEIQAFQALTWHDGHHFHFAEKGDFHWREAGLQR